jgi:hypothetical protein
MTRKCPTGARRQCRRVTWSQTCIEVRVVKPEPLTEQERHYNLSLLENHGFIPASNRRQLGGEQHDCIQDFMPSHNDLITPLALLVQPSES